MGVLGLWSLLEPVGKPVPVESLENKVLAVDISIWLNQAVKGFRDRSGNAVPNAHLLGLYHRLCKLLFYRIKPVFVFDGQPPQLKRDTLFRRRMRKSKDVRKAKAASAKILDNYLKSQAVANKLQRQTFAIESVAKRGTEGIQNLLSHRHVERDRDLFELPDLPAGAEAKPSLAGVLLSDSESEAGSETEELLENMGVDTSDIYKLDVDSERFRSLPKHLQYDILHEMREKRKQNSWAKMHQMPGKAENFSSFQLERLKHRRAMQKTLENIKQDLNQEGEAAFDEQLFVGDVEGLQKLKTELKKSVSRGGSIQVLVSGIREAKERLRRKEEAIKQEDVEEEGEREFYTAEEMDDPDIQLAIAMSLQQEDCSGGSKVADGGSLSKQTAGRKPAAQKRKARATGKLRLDLSESEEDDDDVIILLPAASVITSQRLGGRHSVDIKEEAEDADDSDPELDKASVKLTTGTSIKKVPAPAKVLVGREVDVSTSRNASPTRERPVVEEKVAQPPYITSARPVATAGEEEEDDLFADIFGKGGGDLQTLDSIVERARQSVYSEDEKEEAVGVMSDDSDDKEAVDDMRVVADEIDEVGIMSSSGSDSGSSEAEEESTAENGTVSGQEIDALLTAAARLDQPSDILAEISRQAKNRLAASKEATAAVQDEEPPATDVMMSETDFQAEEEAATDVQDVAETMKRSGHLWMRIASKYAVEAVDSSSPKRTAAGACMPGGSPAAKMAKTGSGSEDSALELETQRQKLVEEMREQEKAKRLLRFTQGVDYSVEEEEDQVMNMNIETGGKPRREDKELQRLGIRPLDSKRYADKIIREAGLEDKDKDVLDITGKAGALQAESGGKNEEGEGGRGGGRVGSIRTESASEVIYSASAPGFTRSSKDGGAIDVSHVARPGDHLAVVPGSSAASSVAPDEEDILSEAELYAIQAELARENQSLVAEMGKADRVANSITDQMYAECQELLQLFGVPWIVSPTEAEAQCAFLDAAGLTQGTITDDSDIWLFGGQKVYKNFFNQEKYVEMFQLSEVMQHFGLNREKLVLLAMLTGSDYTDGVEGVGPVTALEILAEFPGDGLDPLLDLKIWWTRVHKELGADYGMPVGNKIREKLRKLKLGPNFPNEMIMKAYLQPAVDDSTERFSWAVPNLVAIRDFAQERFGWKKQQIDEILKPVVRSLQKSQSQTRIDNFFTTARLHLPDKGNLQGSKRVEEALRRVKGLRTPEKAATPATSKNSSPAKGSPSGGKAGAASRPVERKVRKKQEEQKQNKAEGVAGPSSQFQADCQEKASLIARSCGIVISPSQDDIILQKIEREKKAKEAKVRAAEIFKKSQASKSARLQKKFKRPARLELPTHELSDNEEDEDK